MEKTAIEQAKMSSLRKAQSVEMCILDGLYRETKGAKLPHAFHFPLIAAPF